MYDKYIIVENEFRNLGENDKVKGFQLGLRLPYYRGLGLSMVEDIHVKINGQLISREAITVTLHGNTYTLEEMETEYRDRWEFGEVGIIKIKMPGGLQPGLHQLEITEFLRISYRPSLLEGHDKKQINLIN